MFQTYQKTTIIEIQAVKITKENLGEIQQFIFKTLREKGHHNFNIRATKLGLEIDFDIHFDNPIIIKRKLNIGNYIVEDKGDHFGFWYEEAIEFD